MEKEEQRKEILASMRKRMLLLIEDFDKLCDALGCPSTDSVASVMKGAFIKNHASLSTTISALEELGER